ALRRLGDVAIVSPTPAAPLLGRSRRWRHLGWRFEDDEVDGLVVQRPRFLSLPGLSMMSGLTYGLALERGLARIERRDLVLHGHCAFPDGVGVALAASRLGIPYVVTAHGSDLNVEAERTVVRPQVRWALRRAHRTW